MKKTVPKTAKSAHLKPRIYTRKEIAGFLLNDAVNEAGYRDVRKQVEDMGIDPDSIPHDPPSKTGRERKHAPTKPYKNGLLKSLGDQEQAAAYLSTALEDAAGEQDDRLFVLALQDVIEARRKKPSLLQEVSQGIPELMNFWKLLNSLGFQLVIVPGKKASEMRERLSR